MFIRQECCHIQTEMLNTLCMWLNCGQQGTISQSISEGLNAVSCLVLTRGGRCVWLLCDKCLHQAKSTDGSETPDQKKSY